MNVIQILKKRRLVSATTNLKHFPLPNKNISVYLGIDPTADSLHLGHVIGLKTLKMFEKCGFQPIILVGGATGLIGDPSFRSSSRDSLGESIISENVTKLSSQIAQISPTFKIVNNISWFRSMNTIDFFRDIASHFKMSTLLSRESLKKRDQLNFTEASYQIFQAHDFLHLFESHNCLVQIGGNDQWGNIISGVEYVRKMREKSVFGVTFPLLVDAQGNKFGKSDGNPIWLDESKTKLVDFYNYFVNLGDHQIEDLIFQLTDLEEHEIFEVMRVHDADRKQRYAQRKLADEMMELCHGESKIAETKFQLSQLFSHDLAKAKASDLQPDIIIDRDMHKDKKMLHFLSDVTSSMWTSNKDLKRVVQQEGLRINGNVITTADLEHTFEALLAKEFSDKEKQKVLVVQRGKKNKVVVKVE